MASAIVILSELLYGLICFAGLLGNGVVLYVVYHILHHRQKTSVTIRCISHLAIADLITALGIPVLMTALAKDYWPMGPTACKLYMGSVALPEFAKAFLLVLLGVFCYAMHRGTIYELDNAKVTLMLAACWFLAILITLPIFLYATATENGNCNVYWPENVYASDAFVLIFAICVFLAPLFIGLALNKKRNKNPFPGEDISLVRQTMNLVFVLVGVHLVLLFPYVIGQLVLNYVKTAPGHKPQWKLNFALISGWIWTSTCAVFPVLYHYCSEDFREGLQTTIDNVMALRLNYSMVRSNGVKPVVTA